ncbi:hypothetical protein [Sporosarcina sp. SAFN-010]|uniref:hypothetical protein n=1 Tax=Sporosarcina sp. SAFN-010 TaxID=3387273 RepID=UPI003F7F79E9
METWDGKTEEEIEQEVNDYAIRYLRSQRSQSGTTEELAATHDAQAQCIVNHIGSSYADTFSKTVILALLDNPSWSNTKKAAKQLLKAGAKANIIGFSYELFKALKACEGVKQIY